MTVAQNKPDLIYHFTAEIFLPMILQDGIKPAQPVYGDEMDGVLIDSLGVWLTVNPNPADQQWISGTSVDKSAVRLTIAIPSACQNHLAKWTRLAKRKEVSSKARFALNKTGGKGADDWWVYRGPIETSFIKAVEVHGRPVDPVADRFQLWERRREELRRLCDEHGRVPYDIALNALEKLTFGRRA